MPEVCQHGMLKFRFDRTKRNKKEKHWILVKDLISRNFLKTRRSKIVSQAVATRARSVMVVKTGCVTEGKICMSQRKIMKTVIAPEETSVSA